MKGSGGVDPGISDRSREETYEIRLRNHKEREVEVVVIERFWGDWKITGTTADYRKKDVRTVEFSLPVPADRERILPYTALYLW